MNGYIQLRKWLFVPISIVIAWIALNANGKFQCLTVSRRSRSKSRSETRCNDRGERGGCTEAGLSRLIDELENQLSRLGEPGRSGKAKDMPSFSDMLSTFVLLWAVIDPIGTVPVFICATEGRSKTEQKRIAFVAAAAAAGILLFFIVVGEIMLRAMGVPMLAFQVAGGVILFLFALTMIFGESKPEGEKRELRSVSDVAVFPLATPSLASPGAMMAVVLLTENASNSILNQTISAILMLSVLAVSYLLMLAAGLIFRIIGDGGASIVSRVMGLILASIATTNVLEGVKGYFQ